MRIQEQYATLLTVKEEINEKLQNLDFEKEKELMLWLAKSEKYQKVREKDNQLIILDILCDIWLTEKRTLESKGIHEDIFYQIDSLNAMEKKYLTLKFGILRLETSMPEEYYQQFIDVVITYKISSVALFRVIMRETLEKSKNIVKLARLLKNRNQIITATLLLQEAEESFEKDSDILLELADCWLEGQQWKTAYDCLVKIEKPDDEICELIHNLEGMLHAEV